MFSRAFQKVCVALLVLLYAQLAEATMLSNFDLVPSRANAAFEFLDNSAIENGIVACDGTRLSGNFTADSYDSFVGSYGDLGNQGGQLSIFTHSLLVEGSILLRADVSLSPDGTFTRRGKAVSISGQVGKAMYAPVCPQLEELENITDSAFLLNNNQTTPELNTSTITNQDIDVPAGVYFFEDLELVNTNIKFFGPSLIVVRGELNLKNSSIGMFPSDLKIVTLGGATLKESRIFGMLLSAGGVSLRGSSELFGAVSTTIFEGFGNNSFHFDRVFHSSSLNQGESTKPIIPNVQFPLVRFNSPLSQALISELAAEGITVLSPFADETWLTFINSPSALGKLRAHPAVSFMGTIFTQAGRAAAVTRPEIILDIETGDLPEGLSMIRTLRPNWHVVSSEQFHVGLDVIKAAASIGTLTNIRYAEPSLLVNIQLNESTYFRRNVEYDDFPNDPILLTDYLTGAEYVYSQWAIFAMGVDSVWPVLYGGKFRTYLSNSPLVTVAANVGGSKVAVIDTGAESTHPDLAGIFCIPPDCANTDTDLSYGWSIYPAGHGTMLSGLIGALQNGVGIVGVLKGTASGEDKVLSYSAFDYDCDALSLCVELLPDLMDAILKATSDGADVINLSWGDVPGSSFVNDSVSMKNAVATAAYCGRGGTTDCKMIHSSDSEACSLDTGIEGLGAVVVAAAGNDGSYRINTVNGNQVDDPTLCSGNRLITAPASWTTRSCFSGGRLLSASMIRDDGYVSCISSIGAAVSFATPGEGVTSTDLTGTLGYNATSNNPNYATGNGTSFAAPYLASAVAMLMKLQPSITPSEVFDFLAAGASSSAPYEYPLRTYSSPVVTKTISVTNYGGHGVVNVAASVQALLDYKTPSPLLSPPPSDIDSRNGPAIFSNCNSSYVHVSNGTQATAIISNNGEGPLVARVKLSRVRSGTTNNFGHKLFSEGQGYSLGSNDTGVIIVAPGQQTPVKMSFFWPDLCGTDPGWGFVDRSEAPDISSLYRLDVCYNTDKVPAASDNRYVSLPAADGELTNCEAVEFTVRNSDVAVPPPGTDPGEPTQGFCTNLCKTPAQICLPKGGCIPIGPPPGWAICAPCCLLCAVIHGDPPPLNPGTSPDCLTCFDPSNEQGFDAPSCKTCAALSIETDLHLSPECGVCLISIKDGGNSAASTEACRSCQYQTKNLWDQMKLDPNWTPLPPTNYSPADGIE